ncbi:hypothetical protein ACFL5I_01435 [Planctomycetota bacterium]
MKKPLLFAVIIGALAIALVVGIASCSKSSSDDDVIVGSSNPTGTVVIVGESS